MHAKRKIGLGKGLSSLLGDKPEVVEVEDAESLEIPISAIENNPYQPRNQFDTDALNELSESIKIQGVIQPIAVRRIENGYQLISGERRLKASQLAGLKTIPAYIREATDKQMLELGLIENIQRENLNPMEVAMAYQRLMLECDLRQEELGTRVGKDRTTVTNFLRLLNLPEIVQEGLAEKKLSMGHARALLGVESESQMIKLYNEIINKGLSVRKVEELVKLENGKEQKVTKATKPSQKLVLASLEAYEQRFETLFKKKVIVQADEQTRGEIKIPYGSKAELEEIIEKLRK